MKILQYNVNKLKNKVLVGLLASLRVKEFNIIVVQELQRNPYDLIAYNTRDNGFYLVNIRDKDSRVLIYINKRISIDSWSEVSYLTNAQLITLRLGATQINVYNIYSPPLVSYIDNSKISVLIVLLYTLRIPGEHVVVGDFNLYYSLQEGPVYPYQYTIIDSLINTI